MKLLLALVLALSVAGCTEIREALRDVEVEFCVDYNGSHVCVGRSGGKWKFSADLTPDQQAEIIKGLGY